MVVKFTNSIDFIPKLGVYIGFTGYCKYFSWLSLKIIWYRKSIMSIYKEDDKRVLAEYKKYRKEWEI